jgi:hypothetical protein
MVERKRNVEYVEVDINALSQELAKTEYDHRMSQIPVEDHEVTELIQRSGSVYVEKDIASKWAGLRFQLIESYRSLIMEFSINKNKK